jgi:hypothetical protein
LEELYSTLIEFKKIQRIGYSQTIVNMTSAAYERIKEVRLAIFTLLKFGSFFLLIITDSAALFAGACVEIIGKRPPL